MLQYWAPNNKINVLFQTSSFTPQQLETTDWKSALRKLDFNNDHTLSELSEIWLIIIKLISKMSLGTGALKVGQEPERLRHSKEVSIATPRVGTTPACSRQLGPSHWRKFSGKYSPDPILTDTQTQKGEGKAGSQNPQRFTVTPVVQRPNVMHLKNL